MAVNLIKNGDFEATRVPNPQTQNYIIDHTPQNWSLVYGSGVDLLNDVHSKFGANKTPYGQYVELDGRMNTGISQTVSTSIGKTYRISFDWALPSYVENLSKYKLPDYSSKFDVVADGKIIFSYDGTYGTRNAWTHQDIFITAGSDNTTIQFLEKGTSDAEGTLLDNITLVEVPIVRGNSLYTIVDGPSWTQAEANSVKLGGHLVTINDESEEIILYANFGVQLPTYASSSSPAGALWIGLTDNTAEGSYKWISGDNSVWFETEYKGKGGWIQNSDSGQQDYMILRRNGSVPTGHDFDDYWESDSSWSGTSVTKGIAETPFIRRGDSAYVIVQGPTWEEAEANANKLGGHLVTINDAEENEWIKANYSSDSTSIWIGFNDKAREGSWVWSSGDPVAFTAWNSGEPDGQSNYKSTENAVHLVLTGGIAGKWQDIPNNSSLVGIAEIKLAPNNTPTGNPTLSGNLKAGQVITIDKTPIQDADNFTGYTPDFQYSWEVSTNGTIWTALTTTDATDNNTTYTLTTAEVGKQIRGVVSYLDGYGTQESVASGGSSVTSSTVVRGNSIYAIVDGPSWTQAEANSVKLGGHLVSLDNREEDTWVYSTLGSKQEIGAWIGASDSQSEGKWQWSSGQQFIFSNFANGQPDNARGLEDYAHYYNKWNTDNLVGQWNDWEDTDLTALNHLMGGIAEIPFIRRGDSAYVIVQGPTWEEAEANAVKLGGHLVTINDAAENEWIVNNLSGKNMYYAESNRDYYWTGFKRDGKNFNWIDGTQLVYENFGPGEPAYNGNYGQITLVSKSGWAGSAGNWNDEDNNSLYGIAEIRLAPNNTPIGTPTLSGTFKTGQVITIDKTPIQDADNFTGYTPDFKYTWEVSSNGTTWTPLTTTDTTDNNTTFTLTTSEVGKKVRGVVSFLDGYGTQESVASIASAPITSSAPPVQSLTLSAPSKSTIRSGVSTTSAIAYNVSTGETSLTGVGASLYFDSTQLTVSTAGDPFKTGLLGSAIIADTSNADGDPKTDKVLALTYADFGGNFPGSGTTLPLTLANLNLVPTASYTGTTLHLKGSPASGYTATGADLTLGYNASPIVNSTLSALTINRGSEFTYTFRSDLFTDPDSTLTFSATTATGTALPSWLSFNPATRTLSGTPTTGGTLNINLSAFDELGSVSTPLSIKVREVQQLSSSTPTIRYQRNKDFTLPINYSTTDGSYSTGLAFKVHFNSSLFSFNTSTGVSNKLAAAGLFEVGAVQQDTGDSDNDPTTDKYIPISLASFTGQLPSGSKLADLTFRSADKAIDPITGLKDTSINFSEISVASGYGFSGTSASLKPLSFNLDVDGDGFVTPLGDGLMVIRYLFGNAFAGDSLINKAISPDSPLLGGIPYASMTTQQKLGVASLVATNIQQGIDSNLLDVDKDGMTTPLGDGLMVIRRLFGSAFDGAALTSKAISPESPYFGDPNMHSIVAANIDALKPTMPVM